MNYVWMGWKWPLIIALALIVGVCMLVHRLANRPAKRGATFISNRELWRGPWQERPKKY